MVAVMVAFMGVAVVTFCGNGVAVAVMGLRLR